MLIQEGIGALRPTPILMERRHWKLRRVKARTSSLERRWARWGDALAAAGYQQNEWNGKLDSAEVLKRVAELSRRRPAPD